jgi:BolA protein
MTAVAEQIEALLRARLGALEQFDLRDDSAQHAGHAGARPGGASHFSLAIRAAAFSGLSPVARHRLVYDALGPLMHGQIHALHIRARAPGEPD